MTDEQSRKAQEPTLAGAAPVYVVQRRWRPSFLRQIKGPGSPRDIPLELEEVILGRGLEAQVSIDSGAVSRRHAALRRSNNRHVCVDLDSSNGVYVNGERVASKELREGDTLQVGDALFVLCEVR
jgi:pSer/pThr/pTyr-binding forkhead associated (FHA) protein